ncbi:50S ribosomal protein L3 [Flavobacteriaceae bacterium]|nr:50S ribosomal protein L3 [Flavobacteriaceae bacterium]
MLKVLGKKIGMTHSYNDDGARIPVTLVKVYENFILDLVSLNQDENEVLLKVGFKGLKKEKNISKPVAGLFRKKNIAVCSKIIESKFYNSEVLKVGSSLDLSFVKNGSIISASGISIGKGFAGGMKRHNFGGLEASHGISISHRSHGSTGQCQDPGKVFKGKKMAGHMGSTKVTVKNLKVIDFKLEENLFFIKGSIPGYKGSDVTLNLGS